MATHIVTVGARGRDDFEAIEVLGAGPWIIELTDPASLFLTVVGDVVIDPNERVFLITAISRDRKTLTVRDINAAGGVPPFSGVSLPVEADTSRAYSAIGNAELDIPNIAGPGDTWECRFYNDALISECTVWIHDQTLGASGTLLITVPDTERHNGTAGTGARWQQTGATGFLLHTAGSPPAVQNLEGLEIIGPDPADFVAAATPQSLTSESIDVTTLVDVSDRVAITYSGNVFDRKSREQISRVTVTNTSVEPVSIPLILVFKDISHPSVSLVDPNGITPDDDPYIDLSEAVGQVELPPGETTAPVAVRFNNPSRRRFTFTTAPLARTTSDLSVLSGVSVFRSGGQTALRNLILHGYSTASTVRALESAGGNIDCVNCLVYDLSSGPGGEAVGIALGDSSRILNCTFERCQDFAVAASNGAAQPLVQNCAVFNSGDGFFTAGGWHAESGHNCTDGPSAPGSENRVGRSAEAQFTSLTAGSEDYHLRATADCVDAGLDLSGQFRDDLDGQERFAPWDIGAERLGRVYYVNPDPLTGIGQDSHAGTSAGRPWATVAKVNGAALLPGDTVLFRRGRDFIGQLEVVDSGTEGKPITFGSYGPRTAGSRPEDWSSSEDWPRIGADLRIDLGSPWELHATHESGPTYKIDASGLGIAEVSTATYRSPGERNTIWLSPRPLERIGELAGTIETPGTVHFDGLSTLYVHLLDPNLDPADVSVYVDTGPRDDVTGHFSKAVGAKHLRFENLHFTCGRFGLELSNTENCLVRECLSTGNRLEAFRLVNRTVESIVTRCEVTEAGCGIAFNAGASGKAEDNHVHDLDVLLDRWGPVGPDVEGIGGTNPGDVEVVDNLIDRVGADGIAFFAGVDKFAGPVHIHRNVIRESFSKGVQFSGRGSYTETLVNHNLIIGDRRLDQGGNPTCCDTGLVVTDSVPAPTFLSPLKIINNTFIGCGRSFRPDGENIRFKNNISTDADPANPFFLGRHIVHNTFQTTVGHERDHNCYAPVSEDPPRTMVWGFFDYGVFADYLAAASPQEQSSVDILPELDADFRLTADSDDFLKFGGANVEADLPEGTVDLDGRAVPRAAPSLGARQWVE